VTTLTLPPYGVSSYAVVGLAAAMRRDLREAESASCCARV
jgi:hypothetical protein